MINPLLKAINAIALDYFAPYAVIDNYGTYQLCWSMASAESWLPFCGNNARIVETYDYVVLAMRKY